MINAKPPSSKPASGFRRPPIPRPFSVVEGGSSQRDLSGSSRASLRQTLLKRQSSLTSSEQKYLHGLIENGNEVDVQLAHKRLQDDDVFFDRSGLYLEGIPDFSLIDNDVSEASLFPDDAELPENGSLGSERRQQTLEERRRSPVLGQIWKAHESGMVLTKEAGRRSLYRRSTISCKRELVGFRNEMDDVKSDNNRRSLSSVRKSSTPYRRSRSVTFKDASELDSSSQSMPHERGYSRSVSIGSIPSIRLARALSSGSSVSSSQVATIPVSIPRPFVVARASSIFSVPSLQRAHSVHSQSDYSAFDLFNDGASEKKEDDPLISIPVVNGLVQNAHMQSHPLVDGRHRVLLHKASSTGDEGVEVSDMMDVLSSSSFDETMSVDRVTSDIFRRIEISKTFSDDSTWRMYESSHTLLPDDSSWKFGDDDVGEDVDCYDPWKIIEDEYANGYGGGGTLPFLILGTSANDVDAHPHVLSPPLMESLQAFLPIAESGDNFWMKYSLVKHGASYFTFLQHARGARYSVLAIETIDGEVFGAFTSEPWRKSWNYFGNGESFLWRMRHSRKTKSSSIWDQAHIESEIDVYPFTGVNSNVQLCLHNRLAVGGGAIEGADREDDPEIKDHEWGFGLSVTDNMLKGTSSPCLTFGSPSLSVVHSDGSEFEIMNLELWTFTACRSVDDAERMELGKLFLHQSFS